MAVFLFDGDPSMHAVMHQAAPWSGRPLPLVHGALHRQ